MYSIIRWNKKFVITVWIQGLLPSLNTRNFGLVFSLSPLVLSCTLPSIEARSACNAAPMTHTPYGALFLSVLRSTVSSNMI